MAVYFPFILVFLTLSTGVIWLANKFVLAPKRAKNLIDAEQLAKSPLSSEEKDDLLKPSALVDNAVQIFPVIAFVLILRSFLYEPFQIPSDSMMPTLLDGDFILVNKYNYGLKDPLMRQQFWDNKTPERGEVVVFKYPVDERIDFIKRVVGKPGDVVRYRDKTLSIKPACDSEETHLTCGQFNTITHGKSESFQYNEFKTLTTEIALGDNKHQIMINPQRDIPATYYCQEAGNNPCNAYRLTQDEFIVPEGHYFVLGDNRDHSADSRYWGFVPQENIVGQAVAIWMSFDFERTESDWLPTWVPSGVRFERIGKIH